MGSIADSETAAPWAAGLAARTDPASIRNERGGVALVEMALGRHLGGPAHPESCQEAAGVRAWALGTTVFLLSAGCTTLT